MKKKFTYYLEGDADNPTALGIGETLGIDVDTAYVKIRGGSGYLRREITEEEAKTWKPNQGVSRLSETGMEKFKEIKRKSKEKDDAIKSEKENNARWQRESIDAALSILDKVVNGEELTEEDIEKYKEKAHGNSGNGNGLNGGGLGNSSHVA